MDGKTFRIFLGLGAWLLFAGCYFAAPSCSQQATHLGDNSDWWSTNQSTDDDPGPPQKRELAAADFKILGVELGEKMFAEAAAKLGEVDQIQRGDASTGRIQACYVAQNQGEKVHLIFERGEIDFGFYLFSGGASWDGANLCKPANALTVETATGGGLRLGMSAARVESLLGKPSIRKPDELVYSLMVEKPGQRQNQKAQPYDLGEGVVAKFTKGRLTYLAVSRLESN